MSHSIDLFAVCEFADGHGRPLMANPANNVRGNDRIIDSPAPAFAAAEVRLSPSTRIFIRFGPTLPFKLIQLCLLKLKF